MSRTWHPSDKTIAICISASNGKPVQIILNVYLPFFNSTCQQTKLFIETIDKLQGFLDQYAVMAPIKIVGDYNVQLPQGHKLKNNWYKLPGFNRHSVIMHDFFISNNMIVTDFMFQQSVKYTYFCHKSNIHTCGPFY